MLDKTARYMQSHWLAFIIVAVFVGLIVSIWISVYQIPILGRVVAWVQGAVSPAPTTPTTTASAATTGGMP